MITATNIATGQTRTFQNTREVVLNWRHMCRQSVINYTNTGDPYKGYLFTNPKTPQKPSRKAKNRVKRTNAPAAIENTPTGFIIGIHAGFNLVTDAPEMCLHYSGQKLKRNFHANRVD